MASGIGCSLVPSTMFGVTPGQMSDDLSRCSPDTAGVDPRRVLDFIDSTFANDLDLHSFMLYRKGNVVAEGWNWPYASHRPHMMHSLTKSVTATGVGLAIDEGYFSLDDPVIKFFPQEQPAVVSPHLEAMTIKDLLTMQSGHTVSVSGSVFRQISTSWVEEFFKIPVTHPPGTNFLYSSAVSFMLSAIVTRTTKQPIRDYLEPRVFAPLGITELTWDSSPNGINSGGNGLTWRTVDSLKLGILHLNKGKWKDTVIISEQWVEDATSDQVPKTDFGSGYGYQWWQELAANAYYAEGAFGQFAIVFPEHDAVLAITAGVQNGEELLRLVWNQFPAAFSNGYGNYAANDTHALTERIANLRLLPEAQNTASGMTAKISGKTFEMEPNDESISTLKLDFSNDRVVFHQSDYRGEHTVNAGIGQWIESTTGITGDKLHHQYQADEMKVVANGYWWDEKTFEMTWQFVETAWVDTVTCQFFDDRVSLTRKTNANYASRIQPIIRGRARTGKL